MALRHFQPKGGAEKYSLNLAAHLVKQGHQVRVLALNAQPMDGVEVVHLRKPRLIWHPMRQWVTARILGNALARDEHDVSFGEQKIWGADVVRPGGGIEVEYWHAYRQYRYHPTRIPTSLLRIEPKWWFDMRCERRIYSDAGLRRIIVNSNMIRAELTKHYPAVRDRIRVVLNGATPIPESATPPDRAHMLRDVNLDPNGLTALFVGQEFRRKGLMHAIEAIAIASRQRPDCQPQLLILGQADTRPFQRYAQRLGVESRVRFAGNVPNATNFYRIADLLLLPTYYDPFANVTVEALMCGLPVVTTLRNGGSEIIEPGQTGWILDDPSDARTMATRLIEVADPSLRARMRTAAIAAGQQHHLPDRLREAEAVLIEAAAGRP
jgi:UDP-glucose:(heptosyl)LPS alpha-1,3-glucosyltransferase